MPATALSRKVNDLVEALARAVHCGQLMAAHRKGHAGEAFELAGVDLAGAQALRDRGETLSAQPVEKLLAWRDGAADEAIEEALRTLVNAPSPDRPGLPYHELRAWLASKVKPARRDQISAVASLVTLALQISRDADWLQDLFATYRALGMPICLAQLDLPHDDADLLAIGKALAPKCAAAPYATTPDAWQVVLKKIELWGEQHSGLCDKDTLAEELLNDGEVQPLLASFKDAPPKRVAFFGHSMTMSLHWTTHASWNHLASEVRRRVQPSFAYADFQEGGLNPTRALLNGLTDRAEAFAADETYLLMAIRDRSDCDSLRTIVTRLAEAGSCVHLVDDVRPWPNAEQMPMTERGPFLDTLARETGQVYLDFQRRCMALPEAERESWRPLGGDIHMYTPGHIFYAKELLRHWAQAR